ncbi:UNVERIFIED_CONTAM: hypothetical protein Cloal_4126 [Acetivibrio alkalicellulosi]
MDKKSLGIILGVFLMVAAVFFVKGISQEESQDYIPNTTASTNANTDTNANAEESTNGDSLHERYERIKSSNKPSIIVFSYEGDCCPGTKQFFDNYNEQIRTLLKEYEDKFETMFIDLDGVTREDGEIVDIIAEKNGINQLASFVIRDSEGNPKRVVEGPFDMDEIKSFMDGVL